MKSKIGELNGRPLVITSDENLIKYPELQVSYNNDGQISDIKERKGDNVESILNNTSNNSSAEECVICVGYDYDDVRIYPISFNIDTNVAILDNQYIPDISAIEDATIAVETGSTHPVYLTILSNKAKGLEYFAQVYETFKQWADIEIDEDTLEMTIASKTAEFQVQLYPTLAHI